MTATIACCICFKNSTYHVFRKVDTYQLMTQLKGEHYTGVSYCAECWEKLRMVTSDMMRDQVNANG